MVAHLLYEILASVALIIDIGDTISLDVVARNWLIGFYVVMILMDAFRCVLPSIRSSMENGCCVAMKERRSFNGNFF